MKIKILQALNNSVANTKQVDKASVLNFLDYLSRVYLNTLLSKQGTDILESYIRENEQGEILDFIYRVHAEMLYMFGYEDTQALYNAFIESHQQFINGYNKTDLVYFDMIKPDKQKSIFLQGVCYILRLNIEQINLVGGTQDGNSE